jgi:hypothetical protein
MHGKHHMRQDWGHGWGRGGHGRGMFPIVPMLFFFGFVFFVLPKLGFLLPLLLIGGAIWWMSSNSGSRERWGGWSREGWQQWSREWGCGEDDGEKAKRVEIIDEKPKRDSVEYV